MEILKWIGSILIAVILLCVFAAGGAALALLILFVLVIFIIGSVAAIIKNWIDAKRDGY